MAEKTIEQRDLVLARLKDRILKMQMKHGFLWDKKQGEKDVTSTDRARNRITR